MRYISFLLSFIGWCLEGQIDQLLRLEEFLLEVFAQVRDLCGISEGARFLFQFAAFQANDTVANGVAIRLRYVFPHNLYQVG
jgi:hypothetical protein